MGPASTEIRFQYEVAPGKDFCIYDAQCSNEKPGYEVSTEMANFDPTANVGYGALVIRLFLAKKSFSHLIFRFVGLLYLRPRQGTSH